MGEDLTSVTAWQRPDILILYVVKLQTYFWHTRLIQQLWVHP